MFLCSRNAIFCIKMSVHFVFSVPLVEFYVLGISLYLFKVKILVSLFVEFRFGFIFLNRAMTPFDY